jgi:23S rRNA (cytosine1962-C5)-methyltransferase
MARLGHPWVFGRLVAKPEARIPPGSVVDIEDDGGRWLGRGFYNGHARVGLRVLTQEKTETVDAAFFAKRLAQAIAWREQGLGLLAVTDAMRLVHAEGDGLSGLVVDRYADVIAVEYFAAGMFRWRDAVEGALKAHFPGAAVYRFAEAHVQKQESFDCWAAEPPAPVVVREHGVKFHVAVGTKHKTGFFPDQRDNRLALAGLAAGRRVLDVCCHTGGFGIYAATVGKAASVTGVDLDPESVVQAEANARLNGVAVGPDASTRFIAADAYEWLRAAAARGDKWDVVILDPPKQTRMKDQVGKALAQYTALNRLAMAVVAPGGVLLTCSCSGLIEENDFLESVRRAARDASRDASVFRLTGAAADHPFALQVPEGRYLKAAWCRLG